MSTDTFDPTIHVAFTQYMRPHGTPKEIWIERPVEIVAKAGGLQERGCRLEAEVLTTEMVSLAVEKGEDTLAIEVVENGPGIPDAVDRIVLAAWEEIEQ